MTSNGFTALHRGGEGTPMVCIHGFTDTWRTWELVLPALERHHEVLAPTLAGHAGGPSFDVGAGGEGIIDALEAAMDEAGFERAHLVGNSLGGFAAIRLAQRGRAETVVALAPAGGWAAEDESYRDTMAHFATAQELVRGAAPYADTIVSTPEGCRRATAFLTTNFEHIPAALLAHQIRGAANCAAAAPLIEHALEHGWSFDEGPIRCPARIVWGTADQLLPWPRAAARFHELVPNAEWIELEGIGHLPQLDVPAETADLILGLTAR